MFFRKYKYDAFIVHAVEDKRTIANELYERLQAAGVRTWYSSEDLRPGENIVSVIHEGLNLSRCGIIVFSPDFLEKQWPKREYHILLAKEEKSFPNIIPVLYNVTPEDLAAFDPDLVNRYHLNAAKGLDFVSEGIIKSISTSRRKESRRRGTMLFLIFITVIALALGVIAKLKWDKRNEPSTATIQRLIDNRISEWTVKFNSGLPRSTTGKSISRKEIFDLVGEYAQQKSYYRNEYEFSNGATTIHSKKHVQENLRTDPEFFLQNQDFVLEKGCQFRALQDRAQEVVYVLKNKDSLTYATADCKYDAEHNTYMANVTFTNGIRAVVVNLKFATGPKDKRRKATLIYGFLPHEKYHFIQKDGDWMISTVETPEKK